MLLYPPSPIFLWSVNICFLDPSGALYVLVGHYILETFVFSFHSFQSHKSHSKLLIQYLHTLDLLVYIDNINYWCCLSTDAVFVVVVIVSFYDGFTWWYWSLTHLCQTCAVQMPPSSLNHLVENWQISISFNTLTFTLWFISKNNDDKIFMDEEKTAMTVMKTPINFSWISTQSHIYLFSS